MYPGTTKPGYRLRQVLILSDYLIIAIVVVVVIIAHGWLYVWVRFKIDEGAVLKCLQDSKNTNEQLVMSSEVMSSQLNIPQNRVSRVCEKSHRIEASSNKKEHWTLSKR